MTQQTPPSPPPFQPDAQHHQRPRLRPVRGFPVQAQDQSGKQVVLLGLADAKQVSDRPPVVVTPAVQNILPLMNGERSLDDIVSEVGRGLSREMLEPLVAQLDAAGLLFGPEFDAMLAKMRADFDSSTILPPGPTAAMADALVQQALGEGVTEDQKAEHGPSKLREAMDQWIDESLKNAEKPSFDALPKAIVAPHVDYGRGWMNYGAVWGRMRVVDRPDRVVVLGTNHFGFSTGVAACDKGYRSPLGDCPADEEMIAFMRDRLGEALFAHRYDHEREHSIELQIPWIQHCLGTDASGAYCKVFAALVHDPAVNNGESYDGGGVAIGPFIDALREAIATLPGTTLVVSSADLSHAGPAFGDRQTLAGDEDEPRQFRERVLNHDREMLQMIAERRADDLIAAMAWQGNPTRWCSTGNLVAAMKAVEPDEVEILGYAAAMDQQGMGMVSSAAIVMR
ncbi:MAG TPA: AmmeMemoRadiSam system protein B [Phycisphaerales bacterium]|nr:AmmeMemoRadiSam system protein B [Phycisphaerales bacterium]